MEVKKQYVGDTFVCVCVCVCVCVICSSSFFFFSVLKLASVISTSQA